MRRRALLAGMAGTPVAYRARMSPTSYLFATLLAAALVPAGCASTQRQSGAQGSSHTHRSQLPPDKAARCFARNAEEHSSALVSEVSPTSSGTQVIVRVKNGVTYATASYRQSGSGSVGAIQLMVVSSGRRDDLYG